MGELRIISDRGEPFFDRAEAGRLLAKELGEWRGRGAVVLGIPRGGVAVARELARVLEADLDVVLAHKLGAPGHEELAIGSVTEGGKLFLDKGLAAALGVGDEYVQLEKKRQQAIMARRIEVIRRVRPRVPLAGRVVIVTDDGVATGATTRAAFWAVSQERPEKLIAAIPVGPPDRIKSLADDVDEMICLRAPDDFSAVGQFYERFEPVEDEELLEILREEAERAKGRGG